ncbi:hypothetical protein DFP72DRAFT_766809, partial [Ephemerocybe angulata]
FALEYRVVVEAITGEKSAGLRDYELGEAEWGIVEELVSVLKVFKHATLFFSRGTPNLASVIPAMDKIDEILTTNSLDEKTLQPCIRAACSLAKKTLNRYYDKTDHSENYRIAMVLHPRFKLDYFRSADWDSDWVQTARGITEEVFNKSY